MTPYGVDPAFSPEGPKRGAAALRPVRRRAPGAQGPDWPCCALRQLDSATFGSCFAGPDRGSGAVPRRRRRRWGSTDRVEFAATSRRRARRALPRRRVPRLPLALRGLRPADPRGDGVGHAGRGRPLVVDPRGGRRRGRPRRGATPTSSRPASSGRSPSATGWSRPGSSAPRSSAGPRRPGGPPTSTGSSCDRRGRRRRPRGGPRAGAVHRRARAAGRASWS